MSKKRIAGDPSIKPVSIVIDGKTYNLCFDLGAMSDAQFFYIRQGHDVSLLSAAPCFEPWALRITFPCALRTHHPEIGYLEAQKLVRFDTMYDIAIVVKEAWDAALPKADPSQEESAADPLQA